MLWIPIFIKLFNDATRYEACSGITSKDEQNVVQNQFFFHTCIVYIVVHK